MTDKENRLAAIESRLTLLTWMTGTNTAGILLLLGLALRHG
jgi:hypothetical protein